MIENFAYLTFLNITKECRNELIDDILKGESVDLYDALLSDGNSEIGKIKMEYYELTWLELHWTKIVKVIDENEFEINFNIELLSLFSKWYLDYVANWNYTELDNLFFEEKARILKNLISLSSKWDNEIKNMKITFAREKKMLNKRKLDLEKEN